MFKFLIRNRPFLKGKLRREVIYPYTSVEKCRKEIHKVAEIMSKLPGRVKIIPSEFEKFYSEWIVPENYDEDKAILYFHGGGFIAGTSKDYRSVVSNFSKNCGVKYLVFDYSLTPEKPFPAAIHDSLEIYSWLLETGYKPENIMFVGDSHELKFSICNS